ncbi:MAG TPA: hypothetical protein VKT78_03755 [Fimbriimonadaceae bacterium]|nr:hypothetical protein [Fimbriimonadaceae bacterium]
MPETLETYLVERYLRELRRELDVRGVEAKHSEEILAEAAAHLQEALEAAKPDSAQQMEAVIARFGAAATLAKRTAAEESRRGRRRWFLWPALLSPLMIWIFQHPLPQSRLFHNAMYAGTFYLLLSGVVLCILGFRARRALLGQFAVLCAGLAIGQWAWLTATSIPIRHVSARGVVWYDSLKIADRDAEVARTHRRVEGLNLLASDIERGERIFSTTSAPASVPPLYKNGAKYWLPEGLREVKLGIPVAEIIPELSTPDWREARIAWTGANPGSAADADRLLLQIPGDIDYHGEYLHALEAYPTKPLGARAAECWRMAAPLAVVFSIMAAVATNSGWLLWLVWRGFGRLRRRLAHAFALQ